MGIGNGIHINTTDKEKVLKLFEKYATKTFKYTAFIPTFEKNEFKPMSIGGVHYETGDIMPSNAWREIGFKATSFFIKYGVRFSACCWTQTLNIKLDENEKLKDISITMPMAFLRALDSQTNK